MAYRGAVQVDPESTTSKFDQLRTQVMDSIASGELIAGTKLPTVRQLANDLGVAPYTVARVYRSLEADGFVETRGRNGTVVSARDDTAETLAQVAATEYAAKAFGLGIPAETALEYVRSALDRSRPLSAR